MWTAPLFPPPSSASGAGEGDRAQRGGGGAAQTMAMLRGNGGGPSPELANLGFEQGPAFGAELVLPGRIDLAEPRAERCLIDLVEGKP